MSTLKAIEKEMKKDHKTSAKELDLAHKQLEAAIKDEQRALKVRCCPEPSVNIDLLSANRQRSLLLELRRPELISGAHPPSCRSPGRRACPQRPREDDQEGGQGRAQGPSTPALPAGSRYRDDFRVDHSDALSNRSSSMRSTRSRMRSGISSGPTRRSHA
jgi:hypothetical protein